MYSYFIIHIYRLGRDWPSEVIGPCAPRPVVTGGDRWYCAGGRRRPKSAVEEQAEKL